MEAVISSKPQKVKFIFPSSTIDRLKEKIASVKEKFDNARFAKIRQKIIKDTFGKTDKEITKWKTAYNAHQISQPDTDDTKKLADKTSDLYYALGEAKRQVGSNSKGIKMSVLKLALISASFIIPLGAGFSLVTSATSATLTSIGIKLSEIGLDAIGYLSDIFSLKGGFKAKKGLNSEYHLKSDEFDAGFVELYEKYKSLIEDLEKNKADILKKNRKELKEYIDHYSENIQKQTKAIDTNTALITPDAIQPDKTAVSNPTPNKREVTSDGKDN